MSACPRRPWSELAPVDITMLIESGVPQDCIQGDALDIRALVRLGWHVTEVGLAPPGPLDLGDGSKLQERQELDFQQRWPEFFD